MTSSRNSRGKHHNSKKKNRLWFKKKKKNSQGRDGIITRYLFCRVESESSLQGSHSF